MSRRRKTLSAEDREIWQRVAASIRALHPAAPARPSEAASPATGVEEEAARASRLPPPKVPEPAFPRRFRIGERALSPPSRRDLSPVIEETLARQPVLMDRKTHRAMSRGRMEPEARLDLHGLTLAEAHPELIRFVLSSHGRGFRLILVITGKGHLREDTALIPERRGLLRHQVPQWLRLAPLAPLVMQVAQAHVRHGGSGAYYIYLRRTR